MQAATIIRNKPTHNTQNLIIKEIQSEDVWCPETENNTWVMIQNGFITITGNSAYANAWASKCYKKKGGTWSSVKEQTEFKQNILSEDGLEDESREEQIKTQTKQNIINALLEGKMKDGPGKTSQRPKSWNKGTKSGSEKRKMREEGKRQSDPREVYEETDKPFDPSTLDMVGGRIVPPTSWYTNVPHAQDKEGNTVYFGKGTAPSQYYKHWIGQGEPHERALKRTKDMFGMNPPVKWPKQQSSRTQRGDGRYMTGPNGERQWIAGHDEYDARNDGYFEEEIIYSRLKSVLEEKGWPDRESQRENAPHEDAIPDDIGDYESEEKPQRDNLHADHYEDAMRTLTSSNDPSHARNLVMRGAIGAALGRASMGNSKDPTLRDVMSILRGTHDAMNDHFNLKQAKSDIPLEESLQQKIRNKLRTS
jgi:hypothetical protein